MVKHQSEPKPRGGDIIRGVLAVALLGNLAANVAVIATDHSADARAESDKASSSEYLKWEMTHHYDTAQILGCDVVKTHVELPGRKGTFTEVHVGTDVRKNAEATDNDGPGYIDNGLVGTIEASNGKRSPKDQALVQWDNPTDAIEHTSATIMVNNANLAGRGGAEHIALFTKDTAVDPASGNDATALRYIGSVLIATDAQNAVTCAPAAPNPNIPPMQYTLAS
jgi:hypothetical protein